MIELRHIEAASVIANAVEQEFQRKVERTGSSLHAEWIEDPLIDQISAPLEELSHGKFSRHWSRFKKGVKKVGGKALDVIEAIALYIERTRQPSRRSD